MPSQNYARALWDDPLTVCPFRHFRSTNLSNICYSPPPLNLHWSPQGQAHFLSNTPFSVLVGVSLLCHAPTAEQQHTWNLRMPSPANASTFLPDCGWLTQHSTARYDALTLCVSVLSRAARIHCYFNNASSPQAASKTLSGSVIIVYSSSDAVTELFAVINSSSTPFSAAFSFLSVFCNISTSSSNNLVFDDLPLKSYKLQAISRKHHQQPG